MEDSPEERQENELEVLKSIFMDDVTDMRTKDAWKVWRPLELRITLRPQHSMGGEANAYVTVDMYAKCSKHYPDVVPVIKLENSKGLSNTQVNQLTADVNDMAKSLVGEVMILELGQHIQSFLHANNRPPAKSFYEEMLSNNKRQEEKQALEHQKKLELIRKKEEKARQLLEDEIQQKQEALREETRRRKEQARKDDSDEDVKQKAEPGTPSHDPVTPIPMDSQQRARVRASMSPSPRRVRHDSGDAVDVYQRKRHTSTPAGGDSSDESPEDGCAHHQGTHRLVFNTKGQREIYRGKCLGHSSNGSAVYTGMDMKTGELVTIIEWEIKWRQISRKLDMDDQKSCEQEGMKYSKQVLSIEQELLSLLRLRHRNLVHYLAMQYYQELGQVTVYVLMEYAGGGNLEVYLRKKQTIPVDLLRHYVCDLLDALSYLHSKAVVHKDLRASSVFLDSRGRIRLSDYSLDKRLCELYSLADKDRPGVHFAEKEPVIIGRGGKKADIYSLGLLVLSLAEGNTIKEMLPEVPSHLPADLQDFLTKCLIKDERHRWSAFELLEHDFLKTPIHSALSHPKHKADNSPAVGGQEKDNTDDQVESEGSDSEIPVIRSSDASGQSRLNNEFEVLKWIGKGGFGDVIKVRNKLDARLYAIKRIPLNPLSRQLNRKITREVKLLSRLNHENVVRYYNSWIETTDEPVPSDSSSMSTTKSSLSEHIKPKFNSLQNSLGFQDDIEKFAPQALDESVEWSVSVSHDRLVIDGDDDSSDDDYDDDEDDVFGTSFFGDQDSSDDVIFESEFSHMSPFSEPSDSESTKNMANQTIGVVAQTTQILVPNLQYMYIQMEFCENSTLRNCIDAGLYENVSRLWRLFREIVEGLVHIHEQGMIHRDLKPVNIFLDSNDHVKIGDFGLATTDIIAKQQCGLVDTTIISTSVLDSQNNSSRSGSLGDGNMTGRVGTALYVSPEMTASVAKTTYNQKVDIYSLGIIFFEMCHPSLPTGMERVTILSNLRRQEIILPDTFDELERHKEAHIIRWLLNHDPELRPTSQELLQSHYLPPPQMEEAELNEVLRSAISNPQSKSYKRMINALFSQPVTVASDVTYDGDLHKGFSLGNAIALCSVEESLSKIFQHHGAVEVTTPLFMPSSDLYRNNETYVRLIDHTGLVSLPYDLRTPFARFVARNHINFLKRYSISHVYRERRPKGLHPKALYECAFDIITSSSGNLVPDAEVIYTVNEIIGEFPLLQSKGFYLRMNHISLLRAILIYSGIEQDKHSDVFKILADSKPEKQKKLAVQTKLCSEFSLTESGVASLFNLIETEGPFSKVSSILKRITKTKGPAGSFAKQGLHELEAIMTNLETMGNRLGVIITLSLQFNVQNSSGVMFQVTSDVNRKRTRKGQVDVLAAGSRYDSLINYFKHPTLRSQVNQSAVGVSISVEKILQSVIEAQEFQPAPNDIIVCSTGHRPMLKEQLHTASELWNLGLRADILYDNMQSLEEIQEYCKHNNITHMVFIKDMDRGEVKVRSLGKEKVIERKLKLTEVGEYLQRLQANSNVEPQEVTNYKGPPISTQSTGDNTNNSNTGLPDILFFPQDNKLASNTKRKFESQVFTKVLPTLKRLINKGTVIKVLAVDVDKVVIKTIAGCLELGDTEQAFNDSIGAIDAEHRRHRKYLTRIFDTVCDLKFHSENPVDVFVFSSLKDESFKILV